MLKLNIKPKAITLVIALLLMGASQGKTQTTVSVDPSKHWVGYMNVFDLSMGYLWGQAWGVADLPAVFTGNDFLTLSPNSINDPSDYWYTPSGGPGATGNKIMDTSMYVQDDTLAGQYLVFTGTCLTNTLVSGYTCRAYIKMFTPNYSANTPVTIDLVDGQPFTLELFTDAGTHIQYGFETIGPDVWITDAPTKGKVVVGVSTVDPSLSNIPSQSLVEGQNATFTVVPTGTAPFTYQWSFANATTSGNLSNGGRISGATGSTLTISGVTSADAGNYSVYVSNSKGAALATSTLVVTPIGQVATNMLVDPSFESGAFALSSDAGWASFNGAVLQTTNDHYYQTTIPVSVVEGGTCFETYGTGANSWNGCYQDRPVLPGQIYTANAWFLTPSVDQIKGVGQCWLEVVFHAADGGAINMFKTSIFDTNSPTDTWVSLQPTNVYGADLATIIGSSPYIVAPAGAKTVRFQFSYHADTGGSVYIDAANLRLRAPVVVLSANTDTMQATFPTIYGPTYQVLYKTDLSDPSWQVLTTVMGDATVKTVSLAHTDKSRFYIVNTK